MSSDHLWKFSELSPRIDSIYSLKSDAITDNVLTKVWGRWTSLHLGVWQRDGDMVTNLLPLLQHIEKLLISLICLEVNSESPPLFLFFSSSSPSSSLLKLSLPSSLSFLSHFSQWIRRNENCNILGSLDEVFKLKLSIWSPNWKVAQDP